MDRKTLKKIRQFNVATHRDLGYFFSSLIIIYCISGLALNHVDDWNPDFIIEKTEVKINKTILLDKLDNTVITNLGKLVGETKFKVYDSPTKDQVKIYYDNATFHLNFTTHTCVYEKVTKRAVFYQSNVLHRNSVKGWKWAADIFAALLIVISVSGLFVLRGKYGITGRGKWLIAAGTLPPIIALVIQCLI